MKKQLKICKNGHKFYKSSDCESCPECEKISKPKDGFLSKLYSPVQRALKKNGIDSLEKLSNFTEEEILKLHGIGKTSIPILKKELSKEKLSFRKKKPIR